MGTFLPCLPPLSGLVGQSHPFPFAHKMAHPNKAAPLSSPQVCTLVPYLSHISQQPRPRAPVGLAPLSHLHFDPLLALHVATPSFPLLPNRMMSMCFSPSLVQ